MSVSETPQGDSNMQAGVDKMHSQGEKNTQSHWSVLQWICSLLIGTTVVGLGVIAPQILWLGIGLLSGLCFRFRVLVRAIGLHGNFFKWLQVLRFFSESVNSPEHVQQKKVPRDEKSQEKTAALNSALKVTPISTSYAIPDRIHSQEKTPQQKKTAASNGTLGLTPVSSTYVVTGHSSSQEKTAASNGALSLAPVSNMYVVAGQTASQEKMAASSNTLGLTPVSSTCVIDGQLTSQEKKAPEDETQGRTTASSGPLVLSPTSTTCAVAGKLASQEETSKVETLQESACKADASQEETSQETSQEETSQEEIPQEQNGPDGTSHEETWGEAMVQEENGQEETWGEATAQEETPCSKVDEVKQDSKETTAGPLIFLKDQQHQLTHHLQPATSLPVLEAMTQDIADLREITRNIDSTGQHTATSTVRQMTELAETIKELGSVIKQRDETILEHQNSIAGLEKKVVDQDAASITARETVGRLQSRVRGQEATIREIQDGMRSCDGRLDHLDRVLGRWMGSGRSRPT